MISPKGLETMMQGVLSEEDGDDGGLECREGESSVTRLSTTSVRSENPGEGSVEDNDAIRVMSGGAVRI